MIGSLRAYLACKSVRDHVGVQLQVSDLNFCNWMPIVEYPRDSHVNYARFIMAAFAMFSSVFNIYEFSLKITSQKTIILILKCVIDTIN